MQREGAAASGDFQPLNLKTLISRDKQGGGGGVQPVI